MRKTWLFGVYKTESDGRTLLGREWIQTNGKIDARQSSVSDKQGKKEVKGIHKKVKIKNKKVTILEFDEICVSFNKSMALDG